LTNTTLVIIPTYNERDNIVPLLTQLLALYEQIDFLVVDDNSPDNTAHAVRTHFNEEARVHLLLREKKAGLGRAYTAGFDWALQRNYKFIVQMDADFSHRPEDLGSLIEKADYFDLVIGSRRVAGGGVRNWEWYRRFLSWGGSFYSQIVLGYHLRDWTGGFNGWSRKALSGIDYKSCHAQGYSFQIETKMRALRLNFSTVEVPIIFEERRKGQSKISLDIIFEAIRLVWKLRNSGS
jgi:dolichol-phosphate mannosyltransferase